MRGHNSDQHLLDLWAKFDTAHKASERAARSRVAAFLTEGEALVAVRNVAEYGTFRAGCEERGLGSDKVDRLLLVGEYGSQNPDYRDFGSIGDLVEACRRQRDAEKEAKLRAEAPNHARMMDTAAHEAGHDREVIGMTAPERYEPAGGWLCEDGQEAAWNAAKERWQEWRHLERPDLPEPGPEFRKRFPAREVKNGRMRIAKFELDPEYEAARIAALSQEV